MLSVDNLMKIFTLLEELEEEHYSFSPEEKQAFYRGALYMDSFDAVQEMIVQTAILEIGTAERQELLETYAKCLPKCPDRNAEQMENYIFQLQHMCYEREKAVRLLEDILEKHGISKETADQTMQIQNLPASKDRAAAEKSR